MLKLRTITRKISQFTIFQPGFAPLYPNLSDIHNNNNNRGKSLLLFVKLYFLCVGLLAGVHVLLVRG